MEKRKPHYPLEEIKSRVATHGVAAFTISAVENYRLMGLDDENALQVVLGLKSTMFYKSMTTYYDTSLWQDVYHAPTHFGKVAYIKVTLRDGAVVIQFKEK